MTVKLPVQEKEILFSKEGRMHSIWKVFSMDDRGILHIDSNKISFTGERYTLNLKKVKNVYLTKQTPSYGAHFISGFISIVCIVYFLLIVFASIEYFFLVLVFIVIFYPLSLFYSRSDWIGIQYIEGGKTKRVYFSDGQISKGSLLSGDSTSSKSLTLFRLIKQFSLMEKIES